MSSSAPASNHAKCTTCSSSHCKHVLHTSRNVSPMVVMEISGVPKHAKSQSPLNTLLPPIAFMIVMILPLSPVHLRNQGTPFQQRNGQKVLLILKLMAKSKPVNMLVTFIDATITEFAKSSHSIKSLSQSRSLCVC